MKLKLINLWFPEGINTANYFNLLDSAMIWFWILHALNKGFEFKSNCTFTDLPEHVPRKFRNKNILVCREFVA